MVIRKSPLGVRRRVNRRSKRTVGVLSRELYALEYPLRGRGFRSGYLLTPELKGCIHVLVFCEASRDGGA